MTITFEKAELQKFQAELGEWYRKQFVYVAENMNNPYGGNPHHQVSQLMSVFEKNNPRPDWKSLL